MSEREYSGHDPRDLDCEYDPWDEVAPVDGARCPICSRRPADEVGGWNGSEHDDRCESEFIEGAYAYSPCGCKDRGEVHDA